MPDYRRVRVPGGTYFFTVNLLERRRTLLTDHIDSLRNAFATAKEARPFFMQAYVVLPDQLHCLWRLPPGDDDIATRWRHIKTTFSRSLPKTERLSERRRRKAERGIWQRRYWERVMRHEADYRFHFDYIHYNPVKHGHAVAAADWPHSSFRHWHSRGVYPQAWAEPRRLEEGQWRLWILDFVRGGSRPALRNPGYCASLETLN